MSEPNRDYPLSIFTGALSSVLGRTVLFILICVAAIIIGSWIHVDWRNPTLIIPWTVIVSFISGWGAFFYFALLFVFIRFVRFEGSWIWIPVAFVIQAIDAYLMVDTG